MRRQRRPEPIPIGRARAEALPSSAVLTGRLDSIPLFDLCQFLLLNRRTGTLTVKSGERALRIYFVEGMIHDLSDEAMRTGEHLLLDAVQWTKGTFSLDPSPPGVQRRITDSTEAILLEAARTIDERRSREPGEACAKSQEEIFKERQVFAGELAEAFRAAIDPDGTRGTRAGGSLADPFDHVLNDVVVAKGHVVVRGAEGILCGTAGARSYRSPIDASELLERLGIEGLDRVREGWTVERRIEKLGAWFHFCGTRVSGTLQVRVAHLRGAVPRCEEIGIDPSALGAPPGSGAATPFLFWSGVPGGFRSSGLAAWLARAREGSAAPEGPTLWIEDSPGFAWEALPGASVYGGHPARVEIRSILEWNPQRVVVDAARTPRAARLACDLADAGIPTIAVATGLTRAETLARFERLLERDAAHPLGAGRLDADGARRASASLPADPGSWVGLLPIGDSGLVATQVEQGGVGRPRRTYRDEIERLERERRLAPGTAAHILEELPDLA